MAHPHRPYWLWAGTTMGGVSFAFVGVNGALDATHGHFMFWTSPVMILAYVSMAAALLCFACALRAIPFPFAFDDPRQASSRAWEVGRDISRSAEPGEKADSPSRRSEADGAPTLNERRIYVQDSPKQLTAIFRSHTSAQAQKLLQPYYDQWLRVEGTLVDVGEWTGTFSQVMLRKAFRGPAITMLFTDQAVFVERLSVLRAGAYIVVTGKVKEINALGITITDCELLAIRSLCSRDVFHSQSSLIVADIRERDGAGARDCSTRYSNATR
jgi:tRNA_anti-like